MDDEKHYLLGAMRMTDFARLYAEFGNRLFREKPSAHIRKVIEMNLKKPDDQIEH